MKFSELIDLNKTASQERSPIHELKFLMEDIGLSEFGENTPKELLFWMMELDNNQISELNDFMKRMTDFLTSEFYPLYSNVDHEFDKFREIRNEPLDVPVSDRLSEIINEETFLLISGKFRTMGYDGGF